MKHNNNQESKFGMQVVIYEKGKHFNLMKYEQIILKDLHNKIWTFGRKTNLHPVSIPDNKINKSWIKE